MNHYYDAGPDTGKDCPKDTCNEALTSWLDYPERCDSKSNECECEPVETACKASPDNECCNSVCSMEQGCVTESGTCPGSVDTCTDTILSIGKVCNGCGEGSAKGTCGPGESFECSDASFTNCQSVSCGGDLYYCLEVGGQRKWTASNVCNKDAKDECIPNPCGPCDDADAMECNTGVCCDETTCTFKSSSVQCDTWTEYRCNGEGCGADAEYREATKNCSGSSATCDGATIGSWTPLQNCEKTRFARPMEPPKPSARIVLMVVTRSRVFAIRNVRLLLMIAATLLERFAVLAMAGLFAVWMIVQVGNTIRIPVCVGKIQPSPTAMNWYRAAGIHDASLNPDSYDYCATLGAEWRLPNIQELRSLIRGCDFRTCGLK